MSEYMKKHILVDILQYVGAVTLVVCTLLMIFAFEAGKLPFMDGDYLDTRTEADDKNEQDKIEQELVSEQEQVKETAVSYVSKLDKADSSSVISSGIYGTDSYIAYRPLSEISLTGEARLESCMGYLVVKDGGTVTAVYDGYHYNVTDAINGYSFTFNRDVSGRPLFYGADGYVYLENGEKKPSTYDKYNCDKGLNCEYPSYISGYNTDYQVFEDNGSFGLRRAEDGTVVIPARYADVYSVSEGYSVAVDKDNRLHLYSADGKLISDKYYATDDDGALSAGYFFVRNGITRARTSEGIEVLLRTDGNLFRIPSGFSVVAYSDGVILLKGQSGYGYMHYSGKWLCTPDYKSALPFNEGLAVVADKNGLYGMIDLNGNTVIPYLFSSLSNSSDGVIVAYDQKFGYFVLNKLAK